jgi:ribosomal protein L34
MRYVCARNEPPSVKHHKQKYQIGFRCVMRSRILWASQDLTVLSQLMYIWLVGFHTRLSTLNGRFRENIFSLERL